MTTESLRSARSSATPWYRERWPWLLMAGPAIVIVAAIGTLWLAVKSDDGVIADDYYKRGLLINKDLARANRAEAMQIGGVLAVAPTGALRLTLTGFDGEGAAPAAVRVKLVHATRAGLDRATTLARGSDGIYVGAVDPPPPGRWRVTVETDSWRLPSVEASGELREVRVGAPRPAN